MKNVYYYSATLILFGLQILISIFVNDVTAVFDFVAAIAVSCLGFIFPSVFFLTASKRYLKDGHKKSYGYERFLSYLNLFLGIVAFILGILSNVVTILQSSDE